MKIGMIIERVVQRDGIQLTVEIWITVVRIRINGEGKGTVRRALRVEGMFYR